MSARYSESGTPWYLNSWPWFLVILLGVSIIASLVTVGIAYRHRDVDVRKFESIRVPDGMDAGPLERRSSDSSMRNRED